MADAPSPASVRPTSLPQAIFELFTELGFDIDRADMMTSRITALLKEPHRPTGSQQAFATGLIAGALLKAGVSAEPTFGDGDYLDVVRFTVGGRSYGVRAWSLSRAPKPPNPGRVTP